MNGLKLDVIRLSGPESPQAIVVSNHGDLAAAWIECNHGDLDDIWNDIYVHFSGYFGKFGPHVFAAAPDLLAIAKEAKALLDRGPDTTEAEREDVWRGLSEAIAKAEGATP